MDYAEDITDILDDVVDGMEFPITVDSVVRNQDETQTISVCDIYHAQMGFDVTINGNTYKITDFSQSDNTITLEGVEDIEVGEIFDLYSPKFFHGTPIATDTEVGKIADANDKTPMIWLWENFKEKTGEGLEPVGREISMELYFLTQPPKSMEVMVTDDLYSGCIKPMRRLLDNFIKELIKRSDLFSTDEFDYSVENYAKFGIIARSKGATKSVFMDNLSGVSLTITLKLWHKSNPACECPPTPEGIGVMRIGTTFLIT